MEKKTEDFHFNGISPGIVMALEQTITYCSRQVISLKLLSRKSESVQVYFFDEGEGIGTDIQDQDLLYAVTEGNVKLTVNRTDYILRSGECMLVPSGCPHTIEGLYQKCG